MSLESVESNQYQKGNVINMRSQDEDKMWYLDFIRNPDLSPNAKIVFLNIRANKETFSENFTCLELKCNLTSFAISKAVKELELKKYLAREKKHIKGRYKWTYKTFTRPNNAGLEVLQPPTNKGIVNKALKRGVYKVKDKEVKEISKIPPTPQNETDLKNFLRGELKKLGVKAFNKLVNNHSLILIKKRLDNIQNGASNDPFEIYNDITNNISEPEDMVRTIKANENQKAIDKLQPVLNAWRVQPGGNIDDMKLKLTNQVLHEVNRLIISGKAKHPEMRFENKQKEKAVRSCQETFNDLKFSFKEFITIIRDIYQDRKIALTPIDIDNLDEFKTSGITLNTIEKTLSQLLNSEVI